MHLRQFAVSLAAVCFSVLLFVSLFPKLPKQSGFSSAEPQGAPMFERLIWVVVDALPPDILLNATMFPFMSSYANKLSFVSRAASPTVTLPRLKTMLTGSLSSFLDVLFNFHGSILNHDSVVHQFRRSGRSVVFYGDDTWLKLYSPSMFTRSDGVSSFFVSDWLEVDHNVTRHLDSELEAHDWSILILHYLGIDHVGHSLGKNNPTMLQKSLYYDAIFKRILSRVSDDTLLVICSDHGMTTGGNHGGSSQAETDTALMFASSACTGSQATLTCDQVDIAPTLASMMGVSLPINSIGHVLTPVLNSCGMPPLQVERTRQSASAQRDAYLKFADLPPGGDQDFTSVFNRFDSVSVYSYLFAVVGCAFTAVYWRGAKWYHVLYCGSLFSSSFVEEEHFVWYYFTNTALVLRGHYLTAGLMRLMQAINSTGDKWRHSACLCDLLGDSHVVSILSVATVLLSERSSRRRNRNIVAGVLVAAYSVTGNVWVARAAYVSLALLCSLRTGVALLTMLIHSHCNSAVVAILFVALRSLRDVRHPELYYWIARVSFFSMGNSNSISAFNFAGAYTGLTSANPYLVPILGLILLYSGPLLVVTFFGARAVNLPFRVAALAASAASMVAFRDHLFIFSVFAPAFMYAVLDTVLVTLASLLPIVT